MLSPEKKTKEKDLINRFEIFQVMDNCPAKQSRRWIKKEQRNKNKIEIATGRVTVILLTRNLKKNGIFYTSQLITHSQRVLLQAIFL
jgi:hypothetical protein